MPTLSAMFKLMDGFSNQAAKIVSTTNKTTEAILNTSKAVDDMTDKFVGTGKGADKVVQSTRNMNAQLDATATKANVANNSLMGLLGTVMSLAAVKGIMDISDTYTNSTARLNMVNDGSQTQSELQSKIFEAANRSRGSYTDMAGAVSKMNLLAGDSFSSNDEAIQFTELLQKSLKVSGAGTSEQQSAFQQLTQSMAAGKLQGDEFRSIMENAPMVADAISQYMGVSKGELKELSSQGVITSDIIKEAMFSAGDSIEDKFNTMPMTFADVGQKMQNTLLEKFGPTLEKINGMINSSSGQQIIAAFNSGIDMLANGVNGLVDAFVRGDPIIKAVFGAAILMAGLFAAKMLIAAGASLAANWPILLIFAAIAGVIFILGKLGVSAEDVFGTIGFLAGSLYASVYDSIATIWNAIVSFAEFFANVFNDPVTSIKMLFVNLFGGILDMTIQVAESIDDLFGTNLASGLTDYRNAISAYGEIIKSNAPDYKSYDDMRMSMKSVVDTRNEWSDSFGSIGAGIDNWDFSSMTSALDSMGSSSNPLNVQGTGTNGAVEVNMADEDIQYLRDLAQRDYVARIANNTLAPDIRVEFTGAINRDVDLDELGNRVGAILQNELENAPEGVY